LKNWNWGVVISVSLAIAVVTIPIAFERSPGMKARWMLAQAANAADMGTGDAQKLLDEAALHLEDPESDSDYWHVRMKIALKKGNDQILEVLTATKRKQFFESLAYVALLQLNERRDFQTAVYVCTKILENRAPGDITSDDWNQIAYFRSLCNEDLEKGLAEINLALKKRPLDYQYLDTRAWVLYGMGLLPEALQDAEMAVTAVDRLLEDESSSLINSLYKYANGKAEPISEDGLLTAPEAGPLLWSAGVCHYHRAKILEGLGRTEQAEPDWQWLKQNKLPADDRLH
jgi:tetratricopeptide (TPR) repeat protein